MGGPLEVWRLLGNCQLSGNFAVSFTEGIQFYIPMIHLISWGFIRWGDLRKTRTHTHHFLSFWWLNKDFIFFTLKPWGDYPIWLVHIFSMLLKSITSYIFTQIYFIFTVNVGKHTLHGSLCCFNVGFRGVWFAGLVCPFSSSLQILTPGSRRSLNGFFRTKKEAKTGSANGKPFWTLAGYIL